MLARLGVGEDDWDFLIVGDGSGSTWDYECGWGSVSIDHDTYAREVWDGCMNRGTVNIAEMMAYFQPLNWFAGEEEKRRKKTGKVRCCRAHIITDSEYVQRQGGSGNLMPNRNGALWHVFEDFQRQGIVLHWHWIPRNDVLLNRYVDALSKVARLERKRYNVQQIVEHHPETGKLLNSVYAFNPAEIHQ